MNRPIQFPDSWFHRNNPYRILVVDSSKKLATAIAREIGDRILIERASTADEAEQRLALTPFDLMVLQLELPLYSGVELAKKIKKLRPELALLTLTTTKPSTDNPEIERLGYPQPVAYPADEIELISRCREYMIAEDYYNRIDWLKDQLRRRYSYDQILSLADEMMQVHERLQRVVNSRVPVMITGESGTGKELVARMIHYTGDMAKRPFVVVNCAAVPEGLLESQFFGHEKGAFTGAIARIPGKFELANTGTLFLDEIGEMSPALQSKLLRVLEYGEFERVGGSETIKVDVRLLTATNRNLQSFVNEGRFRADLFYRINVFPIHLPPLRERGEDITLLGYHFLKNAGTRNNRQVRYIHDDAMKLLLSYPWPGNIRELENVVERALLLSDGVRLNPSDFPQQIEWTQAKDRVGVKTTDIPDSVLKLEAPTQSMEPPPTIPVEPAEEEVECESDEAIRPLKDVERDAVIRALDITGGNIAKASRCLGITRNTLYRKIEEHRITLSQSH